MQSIVNITKALADENRVRALGALQNQPLCVCQIIELLGLAPSTVSKHMSILFQAGLIQKRKDGRWHYYKLAGDDAPEPIQQAIAWTLESLKGEKVILADVETLCCVRGQDRETFTACYSNSNCC